MKTKLNYFIISKEKKKLSIHKNFYKIISKLNNYFLLIKLLKSQVTADGLKFDYD